MKIYENERAIRVLVIRRLIQLSDEACSFDELVDGEEPVGVVLVVLEVSLSNQLDNFVVSV